jgi:probable HAF family extracellular repeat protein
MKQLHSIQKWCFVAGLAALAAGAVAQKTDKVHYRLVDLGPSGPAGQPFHITDNGIIAATVTVPDGTNHAVIYFHGHRIDISHSGLLGANSMASGNNGWGQVVGGANTNTEDPAGEDFCGFRTFGLPSATTTCLPYLWQNGNMIALPTLDGNRGNNGVAAAINDSEVVAGLAENTTPEPSCPLYDPGQMQFQQYQYKPVVWRDGIVTELDTVGGDGVGAALAINNRGQVAGGSGACAVFNQQFLLPMHPLHAMFWDQDGTPTEIPSLGGNEQSPMGNLALGINNSGRVVGFSSLPDNGTFHGFLWTRGAGGVLDLGTAAGMPNSAALAINDTGVMVGVSTDFVSFVATIWKHGRAIDLNSLVPANSPLHLLTACSINSRGQIIGLAVDGSGNLHGYELVPGDE